MDERPYTGGKPGRVDVNGVEWWACDPYPTWYRRGDDGELITAMAYEGGVTWPKEGQ